MRFTKSLGKPLPYRSRTASAARLPLVLAITVEMYHIVIHERRNRSPNQGLAGTSSQTLGRPAWGRMDGRVERAGSCAGEDGEHCGGQKRRARGRAGERAAIQQSGVGKAIGWFTLIFVGPAILGLVLGINIQKNLFRRLLQRCGLHLVHAIPTAWEWKFSAMPPQWVLITLKDSTRFAGYCGPQSFISSDPAERDMYIEQIYDLDADYQWVNVGRKEVPIASGEIQTIEFWPCTEEETPNAPRRCPATSSGTPSDRHGRLPTHRAGRRTIRSSTNGPGPPDQRSPAGGSSRPGGRFRPKLTGRRTTRTRRQCCSGTVQPPESGHKREEVSRLRPLSRLRRRPRRRVQQPWRRVSSRVGRNMPEPIPVILLGQLAVDTGCQGRRLGLGLLVDAARRAHAASDPIGARAIVVQAIDERAKSFYARFGFRPFSEREPLMLLLRTSELAALLEP